MRHRPSFVKAGTRLLPGSGGERFAIEGHRPFAAGQFEDRGHKIDDVAGMCRSSPRAAMPCGPVDDQRRGDAALVDPRLVQPQRRVGRAGPARPKAEERLGRAGRRGADRGRRRG